MNTTSAVTVNIDGVVRSDFDSSTSSVAQSRSLASLEDLTTGTNGPIKLVAEAGSIIINGGADAIGLSADGTGDVLLEARGGTSDVIVNATITSGSGNITLQAGRNVDLNATVTSGGAGTIYVRSGNDTDIDAAITSFSGDILIESANDIRQTTLVSSTAGDIGLIAGRHVTQSATGDITTATGDVLVQATTGNWTMDGDATITAGGQDVLGLAGTNITLGVITLTNATANRVALQATAGSLTDANGAAINVQETVAAATTSLSLRAGTIIGGAGGTTSATKFLAIDINVDTVAASSATGIYLREVAAGGAIEVNTTSAVTVNIDGVVRSDFDSSTSSVAQSRSLASLEDLTTGTNGPIKLVAEAGSIIINGGADAIGLSADGTGDVLLEARGGTSDVIVNATITSGSGNITLQAGRNVDLNATVTSGGAGTIYVRSGNDTDIDASITSFGGDILIESANDIRQTALDQQHGGRHRTDRWPPCNSECHGRYHHRHRRRARSSHHRQLDDGRRCDHHRRRTGCTGTGRYEYYSGSYHVNQRHGQSRRFTSYRR